MIHHAVRGRSTLLGLPRPSTVLRLICVWDSASCWQIAPHSSQGPNCDLYSWILFFQYCNASHPSMETGGHVLWWIEGIETAFMPSLPKFRCFLAIGASNSSNLGSYWSGTWETGHASQRFSRASSFLWVLKRTPSTQTLERAGGHINSLLE